MNFQDLNLSEKQFVDKRTTLFCREELQVTAKISKPFRDNESKTEHTGMFNCQINLNNVGLYFDYSISYIEISQVQKTNGPFGNLCSE